MSASHPLKTLLLKKSQQLDLNGRRKFAYFVKEKSTAAGCLQQSLALNVCAGKRSLFVTEQLTFQQVLRNGVAVNGDKRAILATATAMNSSCGHFFPCTALPQQQHRDICSSNLANKSKDGLHLRAGAQHLLECFRLPTLLQLTVSPLEVQHIDASAKNQFELIHFHGLTQKIVSARAYRLDRVSLFALSRDHNDLRRVVDIQHVRQGCQPFFGMIRARRQA